MAVSLRAVHSSAMAAVARGVCIGSRRMCSFPGAGRMSPVLLRAVRTRALAYRTPDIERWLDRHYPV